jgi:hypothetical protein
MFTSTIDIVIVTENVRQLDGKIAPPRLALVGHVS